MTYDEFQYSGHIELNKQELSRLENGAKFVSVVRPAKGCACSIGHPGDVFWASEVNSLKPKYSLRVVSNFQNQNNWIVVMARLMNFM